MNLLNSKNKPIKKRKSVLAKSLFHDVELNPEGFELPPKRTHHSFFHELKNESNDSNDSSCQLNEKNCALNVSNLNLNVLESDLAEIFSKFGPLKSVKISCRRTPKIQQSANNNAFVCFEQSNDAELAFRELQGFLLLDSKINLEWTKSLSLSEATPEMETPKVILSCSEPHNSKCVIQPTDPKVVATIHLTVWYVLCYGLDFEYGLKRRENGNEKFRFLWDSQSLDHLYYIWKFATCVLGEPTAVVFNCSLVYKAPADHIELFKTDTLAQSRMLLKPLQAQTQSDSDIGESDSSKDEDSDISCDASVALCRLLKTVSIARAEVGNVMAFCIERSSIAAELAETVVNSLLFEHTLPEQKLARFYVLHDILHNCGLRDGCWKYRQVFEDALPEICASLAESYNSITTKLKAERFRAGIFAVFDAWKSSMMFPQRFIDQRCRQPLCKESKSASHTRNNYNEASQEHFDGVALQVIENQNQSQHLMNPFYPEKVIEDVSIEFERFPTNLNYT